MYQDMVRSMCYKLIIMGVPIDGDVNVSSENWDVWKRVRRPETTINNNHVFICFHTVCEAVASHVVRVGFLKEPHPPI